MSITEHQRNKLHNRAHEVFGAEEGDSLMELLPSVGWADVARRSDVDSLGRDVDHHVATLRQDMDTQVQSLRQDMDTQVQSLRQDIDHMRQEITRLWAALDVLRTELTAEIRRVSEIQMSRTNELVMRSQNRIILAMMGTMLTTVIAVSGLAFAAAGLI